MNGLTKKDLIKLCNNNNIKIKKSLNKTEIKIILTDCFLNKFKRLKFIDLFCGIGGFHIALNNLGCDCILACDIDKNCRETYLKNNALDPLSDIKDINEIKDFDILAAGFPCQPFSNGGNKKTFNDKRGLLFDEIIRIAKVKKPRFMLLENVKHILKVGEGKVIEYIKKEIKSINYNLQLIQISPHNFGIPQQRERVFFVCVRNDIYLNDIVLKPCDKEIKLDNFLEEKVDDKYYLKGDVLNVLEAWNEIIKIFKVGEKISPTILIHDYFRNIDEEEFKTLSKWRQDYMIKNKPLIDRYKNHFVKWYDKHKVLLMKREIYGKLEWQVGKIKENDSIFNYFIQIRQSGIRVKKAKYFPTLVAISQIPIYGKEKRYITPRECARLQSFPDNFILHENDKVSYKQFGNSVNVSNVQLIFESMFKKYNIINLNDIILIQKNIKRFITKRNYIFNIIIDRMNNNKKLLSKCYENIIKTMKMFPPKKNENKFIYGKVIELILIKMFDKIFLKCVDLDECHESKSEYKNECEIFLTDKVSSKFSIKVVKNKGNIIIINKHHVQEHCLNGLQFIICHVMEKNIYIFKHNKFFDKYVVNTGSNISYKSSLLSYLKKSCYNVYKFSDETFDENVKEINIYEYILDNLIDI